MRFLLLIFFCSSMAFSQSDKDSLWNAYKSVDLPDTLRLDALYHFTWNHYLFTQADSAYIYAQTLLETADSLGERKWMAQALNIQGISHAIRGNNYEAIYLMERMLSIDESRNDSAAIASSMNNLAVVHENLCEFERALELNLKSLSIKEKMGNKKGVSYSYNNIGNNYRALGEIPKAYEYLSLSLKMKEEMGDKAGAALTHNNLGLICLDLGDTSGAKSHFTIAIKDESGHSKTRDKAMAISNLGITYDRMNMTEMALKNHETALSLYQDTQYELGIATELVNLGALHLNNEDYQIAKDYFKQAEGLAELIESNKMLSLAKNYLGQLKAVESDYEGAIELHQEALEIAERIQGINEIEISCRLMANSLDSLGKIDEAHTYILQAHRSELKTLELNLPILSESEKEVFFNKNSKEYERYYDFTAKYNEAIPVTVANAYDYALMSKGLLLKSTTALRNVILSSGDSELNQSYNRWLSLKRRVYQKTVSGSDPSELQVEADSLEKDLVLKSTEFSANQLSHQLTWQDVRSELDEKSAAVEFIRFMNRKTKKIHYAAMILSQNKSLPVFVSLFSEDSLIKLIEHPPGSDLTYVKKLYGTRKEPKDDLYKLIWKPIESELIGMETVNLSPAGLLHKISFSSLTNDKGEYITEALDLNVLSSTGQLCINKQHDAADDSYLVVGGIEYKSEKSTKDIWDYLPGTLDEANEIDQTLTSTNHRSTLLTGQEGSEENFKNSAPSATHLHLATHGFFFADPKLIDIDAELDLKEELIFRSSGELKGITSFTQNRNPLMRAGLILAGANEIWNQVPEDREDGVLTAAEVATIDMRKTELVVLSACETGLGDIKGSEGVYGLQRSFKMAGVKHLIMSLWQVPDEETAEFMTTFYKNLSKSDDINQAFKDTQKIMRKKYDPYFWAAFVLVE